MSQNQKWHFNVSPINQGIFYVPAGYLVGVLTYHTDTLQSNILYVLSAVSTSTKVKKNIHIFTAEY